jgi:TolA-binding protein
MTAPDLHPEDLIERAEQGRLTASERARLEAHVRLCIACRFERMARVEFRREAEPLPGKTEVTRLVARLLLPTVERRGARSALGSRLRRVGIGAAVVFAAGLGAAAVRSPEAWVVARPMAPRSAGRPSSRGAEHVASTRQVSVTGPAVAPDRGETDRPPRPAASGSTSAVSAPASIVDRPSASALFESAAVARHAGDHSRATKLYRSLIRAFPESPEAQTALVLFGRMLLDEGDDEGAIVEFDRYLQSKGVLEQDALVGRALALERLGRPADASQAWLALLRTYPNSAHADRARSHLAGLAQR